MASLSNLSPQEYRELELIVDEEPELEPLPEWLVVALGATFGLALLIVTASAVVALVGGL